MSEPFWERKFRGQNMALGLDDINASQLRQIKGWFGDDYGIPAKFISLLLMGEIDALTAALWLHGEKVGNSIGDPLRYVFNLSEFEEPDKPKRRPGKAAKGPEAGDEDPTLSVETPTS